MKINIDWTRLASNTLTLAIAMALYAILMGFAKSSAWQHDFAIIGVVWFLIAEVEPKRLRS